ncbi:hypothetical protein HNQ60_002016 [Povalibacter uvarum]|uniref:DUF2934 domain-containing protein n=1 Tax=Povalibacter uvarum TaxID=732238 RepID=A0A841HLQ4_9GAMM|nr:DUF2934 domain-containing protein [Povalibacter uvarum]MBB6093138.1 hypothetical protein [Povalibacter uvarum]
MQGHPGIPSTAKSPRKAAAESPAKPKTTIRARKKTPVAEPEVAVLALHPTPDEVNQLIATTAYYFAAERNFESGHELDDWLKAEQLVQGQLPR